MKNIKNKQTTLNKTFQRVLLITMLMIVSHNHFLYAQCAQPKGAQSNIFGNPYSEAFFSNPIIHGSNTVCNGQTTNLSVDSGYYSYLWSNGNTTRSIIVGAGSYTITVSDAIGCTRSNSIIVLSDSCSISLNLKCYIQGYYAGSGTMTPVLMNEGIGTNALQTDTIIVELHDENSPYSVLAISNTMLYTNGTALANFTLIGGNYYVAVKHRNGLYTWSAEPIVFSTLPINYDFTTASNKAYGNNMIEIEPGIWAYYSGDIMADENMDLLDMSILETDISNFIFGYYAADLNGDGNVDLLDTPILEVNINNFIFSNHP